MRDFLGRLLVALALVVAFPFAHAQTAGAPGPDPLAIVSNGRAVASLVVADDAGEQERLAATDLVKYVEMMSGARLQLLVAARGATLPAGPVIVLGKAALAQEASLGGRLRAAAKQKPVVQADAIVLKRAGERLYVAGNSDRAHYFAVSRLLQEWGCRWYLPTAFGEVVPEQRDLSVGALDHAYGSPFEIRNFWLAWLRCRVPGTRWRSTPKAWCPPASRR